MEHADDQHVIRAILDGDVNAYAVLVARYQKPIYNLMFRMSGSAADAADLAQETFIKAYEQLHRFREGKTFFPWLYTIGLNHCKNFLHRRKSRQDVSTEDCELDGGLDYPSKHEERLLAQLDFEQLREALGQLPIDYREALILRYHEELALEDVAVALEISLSCAKMRVHRGLKKLREMLEKTHYGKETIGSSAG
jgi:RNA polymerase sigma-70 factor (ECF subfamily)